MTTDISEVQKDIFYDRLKDLIEKNRIKRETIFRSSQIINTTKNPKIELSNKTYILKFKWFIRKIMGGMYK